ncbi:hypothetical protein BN1723_000298 [Verticillium longisporum]|uniref:Fumarylacetoacetase-like C-terminal domain-containing protein n=1 Tax=Verticillium longisporum TaxID=100787 RepID=A0A0G4LEI5_VERLO|nr:hypothetical protein BN1723_000298 [Verticillium longisporum]
MAGCGCLFLYGEKSKSVVWSLIGVRSPVAGCKRCKMWTARQLDDGSFLDFCSPRGRQEETGKTGALSTPLRVSYAMSIDLTARNVQNEAKKKGLPWSIAKGFDTFLPMSNIIPKASIPDPHNVEIFLKLNGETKQDASTNLMLFRLPRLLADISKVMTLEKGDIILTGTPAGVGPAGPGDVIAGGVRVNGKELVEGRIEYAVEESTSSYEFKET